MLRRPRTSCYSGRAFTLVEVLLSIALLATLLLSLNQFILSMGELWGRNSTRRLFEQHVRAVGRHVEDMLRRGALAAEPDRSLRLEQVRAGGTTAWRLTFDLAAGDRLLPWPGRALPDVQCALDLEPGRGLLLQWQSRWELDFERGQPRSTVLSPFAERIEYEYYQRATETWETREPGPAEANAKSLPARLRIHFRHGALVAQREVVVPVVGLALPAF